MSETSDTVEMYVLDEIWACNLRKVEDNVAGRFHGIAVLHVQVSMLHILFRRWTSACVSTTKSVHPRALSMIL